MVELCIKTHNSKFGIQGADNATRNSTAILPVPHSVEKCHDEHNHRPTTRRLATSIASSAAAHLNLIHVQQRVTENVKVPLPVYALARIFQHAKLDQTICSMKTICVNEEYFIIVLYFL